MMNLKKFINTQLNNMESIKEATLNYLVWSAIIGSCIGGAALLVYIGLILHHYNKKRKFMKRVKRDIAEGKIK